MSGRNFKEIKRKILEDPVRSPADVMGRRKIPADLNAICLKALLKQPEDRYSSMDVFVTDLRNHLLGRPVSVYKASPFVSWLTAGNKRPFSTNSLFWVGVGIAACLFFQAILNLVN
jgi:hypothetical protein